jgi:FkbH-like protein
MLMDSTTTGHPIAREDDRDRAAFLDAVAAGDIDRIRAATRQYLLHANSPARAARFIRGAVQKAAPEGLKPFRVALLSSFSIELLQDPLIAYGYTEGLAVETYQAGYDQYHQEILSANSGLHRAKPDLIVLAVDGPRWAPDLYDRYLSSGRLQGAAASDAAIARIGELIATLRRHTAAPVLLHSLSYPRHPALGILDAVQEAGQRRLIGKVNDGIAALGREHGAVYLVDVDSIIQSIGYESWYDARLDFFARSPIARSAYDALARYYLRYLRSLSGNSRKCLILDLDNTLWGGVLGEEGPLGIQLGSEYPGNAYVAFQRAVLALRDRGVVLGVASKNNIADVEEVFASNPSMLLKLDHFSAREIHWESKSKSIARIVETLNLGIRHMVFADDNPAECAEVARACPGITIIQLPEQPEKMVDALLSEGLFDSLQFSDEDARRADLYRQREAAESMRASAGSTEDYYRSLQMRLHLKPVTDDNLARASQMTRKTTQFNTTTRLYSEAELDALRKRDDWKTLTMRVVDSFGDNGIVGLMLARREGDHYDIDTCLMSCRVINRGVETAMLNWLAGQAREQGLRALEGWLLPTKRNIPVRELFAQHGFAVAERTDQGSRWRLELVDGVLEIPGWLEIIDETEA